MNRTCTTWYSVKTDISLGGGDIGRKLENSLSVGLFSRQETRSTEGVTTPRILDLLNLSK